MSEFRDSFIPPIDKAIHDFPLGTVEATFDSVFLHETISGTPLRAVDRATRVDEAVIHAIFDFYSTNR